MHWDHALGPCTGTMHWVPRVHAMKTSMLHLEPRVWPLDPMDGPRRESLWELPCGTRVRVALTSDSLMFRATDRVPGRTPGRCDTIRLLAEAGAAPQGGHSLGSFDLPGVALVVPLGKGRTLLRDHCTWHANIEWERVELWPSDKFILDSGTWGAWKTTCVLGRHGEWVSNPAGLGMVQCRPHSRWTDHKAWYLVGVHCDRADRRVLSGVNQTVLGKAVGDTGAVGQRMYM